MPSLFYNSVRAVTRPLVRLLWNPRITGLDRVPREGGFIVASNHLANIDSFVIPVAFPRQVRFVTKDDFWKGKGPRGRIVRWFFEQVGSVPLDREALSSGKGALQAGLEVLRAGGGFAIYPEGARSRDGLLHPGKQGAAWLALESGCPVLPVGLKGTPHLLSRPRLSDRGIVSVRIGAPIDFADIDPALSKGARRRVMTARIMDEIQQLSGQHRSSTPTDDAAREEPGA